MPDGATESLTYAKPVGSGPGRQPDPGLGGRYLRSEVQHHRGSTSTETPQIGPLRARFVCLSTAPSPSLVLRHADAQPDLLSPHEAVAGRSCAGSRSLLPGRAGC